MFRVLLSKAGIALLVLITNNENENLSIQKPYFSYFEYNKEHIVVVLLSTISNIYILCVRNTLIFSS